MDFTDRTEGKAKQVIENNVRRTTNFAPAPLKPPSSPSEPAAEAATNTLGPEDERMIRL